MFLRKSTKNLRLHINRINFLIGVITTVALLLLATPAPIAAAPGDLDPTFGSGGKVITAFGNFDDAANGVAIQQDGKIVAAGFFNKGTGLTFATRNYDFALVRYNTDGTLDNSFGTGGKVTTDLGGLDDAVYAIALQPDGKIVVAGIGGNSPNYNFAVARYNTNGTLDSSFGNGGKVNTPIGSARSFAYAVAVQSDGKIIVAGSSATTTSSSSSDFALVRYNADGSLDASFGAGGKVVTAVSSAFDAASAVAVQTDGKIILVGGANTGTKNDFAVVRYNTDGSLDNSFGAGGKVTVPFGGGTPLLLEQPFNQTERLLPSACIIAARSPYLTTTLPSRVSTRTEPLTRHSAWAERL